MARHHFAVALALLVAGASAQDTMTPAMGPGMMSNMSPNTAPPAGGCGMDYQFTSPSNFSDAGLIPKGDNLQAFSWTCPSGSYITSFITIDAVAPTTPADNRIFSIQAQCSDAAMSLSPQVNLTAPAASAACTVNFTAGSKQNNFTSNSNPPAFWNTYYRYDSFLDGLLGFGSFSGPNSNPGVFGCPNNKQVVGYVGTRTCQGFTALQMQCATCTVSSSLNNEPWGDAKQGTQGNPSNPQPNLQCTSGNAMVDAASNPGANATLLNMTTALQGVTAYQSSITPTMEMPTSAGTPAPAPSAMVPIMQQTEFICPVETYVTSWSITAMNTTAGVRVSNISAVCSDLSVTSSIHVPDACPMGAYRNSTIVKSDSNPPAWWNIFIKTDGSVLDSFLNQGASLSVGMPFVTPCPNNTYVMGLQAIAGCGGFTSLSLTCSPCQSALVTLGGPNSPDGIKYQNARTQALSAYATYGLLAANNDASPDSRNPTNMLPATVKDGSSVTLLVTYPTTGPGAAPNGPIYPTFPMKYQTAFVEGLTAVLNSTDPDVKVTYKTVRLNGTNGRRLLQASSTQSVFVDTNIVTTKAASASQLLTSTQGQAGLTAFIQGQVGNELTVDTPTVSEASSTSASPTGQSACTGKYHFGKWCHTSIRRGGIIAIIVIGSLILVALLAAVVFGLLAMAARRRRTTTRTPAGATPWNDPAASNANVATANRA